MGMVKNIVARGWSSPLLEGTIIELNNPVMSGFGMLLIWWHELSLLLIYQCISDTAIGD